MKLPACNEYSKDKKRPHFLRFLGSGVLTLHNEILSAVTYRIGAVRLTKSKLVKIKPYSKEEPYGYGILLFNYWQISQTFSIDYL